MLAAATHDLIALIRSDATSLDDLNRTAQRLLQAAKQASPKQRNDSLRTLAELFDGGGTRTSPVAVLCGALVEMGADPSPVIGPLLERLPSLLSGAATLVDACLHENAKPGSKSFEEIRNGKAALLPGPSAAWEALIQYWCFAIAVFSVSPEARASASNLRSAAAKIAPYHPGGGWIELMLSVLHDAPIAVIEPQTRIGMLGRVSGVADNFQLNVLVMDGFPAAEGRPRRVSDRVVDVASGRGPQQISETVKGCWNLYNWRAIRPGLMLPDPKDPESNTTWIWNEGKPEQIPVLDGRRVILLGPPSYLRGWAARRTFAHLPAVLERERILTADEVDRWLQLMLRESQPGTDHE
jgi:hypothetical protein